MVVGGQHGATHVVLAAALLACCVACSNVSANSNSSVGFTKIDDMEGSRDLIDWQPPPGLIPGSWGASTDCTEAHDISPLAYFVDPNGWSYATVPAPHETFAGIVSAHAARLRTTSPLEGIWGASIGFEFAELPNPDGSQMWPPAGLDAGAPDGSTCRQALASDVATGSVDLSAYSGITFWAMADPAGAKTLFVTLNDRNTDPHGGICNAADPSDTSDCYNGFGQAIALTGVFTRYTIEFSSLQQQEGWGYHPNPSVLDVRHVYGPSFQINLPPCPPDGTTVCASGNLSAVSFDFWIDDLYFVNK
jgi:hypothetical protein